MPNYSYRCPDCGETFRRLVPISQRKEQKCECGTVANQVIEAPWQEIDINSDRWVTRHKKRMK